MPPSVFDEGGFDQTSPVRWSIFPDSRSCIWRSASVPPGTTSPGDQFLNPAVLKEPRWNRTHQRSRSASLPARPFHSSASAGAAFIFLITGHFGASSALIAVKCA